MRVLVVSPHPDDEAIGCGGTLRRHVIHGDQVRVLFLTSGEQGGHGLPPENIAALREREAREAADILGIEKLEFWRRPDGGLRATQRLARRLAGVVQAYSPDLVYVPNEHEAHADHRAAARLTRKAMRECKHPPVVHMFEVWTPLQHLDQVVDITLYVDVKLAAIRAYRSQCGVMRFDEAFFALARYRGEMHCWPKDEHTGRYAEAFLRQTP